MQTTISFLVIPIFAISSLAPHEGVFLFVCVPVLTVVYKLISRHPKRIPIHTFNQRYNFGVVEVIYTTTLEIGIWPSGETSLNKTLVLGFLGGKMVAYRYYFTLRSSALIPQERTQVMNADQFHIIVENLTLLFLECCRNNINEEKLYQFLALKRLNSKYAAVIVNEYEVKKNKILDVCAKGNNMLYYHDLRWRLEAKVGSRSLPNQMVPLFSVDLKFGDTPAAADTVGCRHELVQADAATLSHVADTLAKASSATRSRHFRKIRKEMKKLALDPQI